jgi:hypothetical protein
MSKKVGRESMAAESVGLRATHHDIAIEFQLAFVRPLRPPVRRPSEGQLLYERRNGQFVLQVTGHPKYGVPLGQDRIVPIFLSTLAIQRKSQTTRANRSGHAREQEYVCSHRFLGTLEQWLTTIRTM